MGAEFEEELVEVHGFAAGEGVERYAYGCQMLIFAHFKEYNPIIVAMAIELFEPDVCEGRSLVVASI